ncbi:MAG: protease modulator HflC [Pseudolabrys sp.]
MRLNVTGGVIVVLAVAALIVAYLALFTVYPTQQALVLRFGKPQEVVTQPGLHMKMPFIDTVVYIDKRILDLESPPQEVIASDQKRLVVDAFARYRIKDALRFYQTLGSKRAADNQLAILLNSALRRVLGEATFIQVVRDERAKLMDRILSLIDGAAEYRAEGAQRAQEIRSRADREVTVLLADAKSKGEQIRGEGDAKRNEIFAKAFGKDPEFFQFYRSMQAYEHGFKPNDTRFLLRPDSNFFRYFNHPSGKAKGTTAAAPAAPLASGTPSASVR